MKKSFIAIGIIIVVFAAFFFYSIRNSEKVDNFEKVKKDFQSGNYSVIVNIPKDYYIRPEFYTNYNPNERSEKRNAIYGYGVYPSEVIYSTDNISSNQIINVYALIFASAGVYSYQGIGLNVSSQNDLLFESRIEPSDILLSPKYVGNTSEVSSDWAYKLNITITTKKEIPKGVYVFKLVTANPSSQKDREYSKVNGTYVSGSPIQPSNLFDFVLEVKQ
jgi:hypothetical protein